MLSQNRLEAIVREKCEYHNVNVSYFMNRMQFESPSNTVEAVRILDDMMSVAFMSNNEEMFQDIQELPDDYYI